MKLAFVSDTHWGFAQGSVRDRDAFDQSYQALTAACEAKPDAILMPGDLYNDHVPTPEAWHDSFVALKIPYLSSYHPEVKISYHKNGESKPCPYNGIPVIALHGTHDYRSKDFKNALDILETAGFLMHVHAGYCKLEKNGETVCVFGLSGVPEKKARDVLQAWNPKAISGAYNLLMIHQSIKEFLPTDDEMAVSLSLSDLPRDFNLLVNGHLHWPQVHDLQDGRRFLLCGSTVTTQMKKLESTKPKGWWLLDTQTNQLDFFPIEKQRKLFYHSFKFKNETPTVVEEKIVGAIESSLQENGSTELTPLIRVKVSGTLGKGYSPSDVHLLEIERSFEGKAIVSLDKNLSSDLGKVDLAALRAAHQEKKSVSELGFEMLQQQLSQTDFPVSVDVKRLFELLLEEELDQAAELLIENKELI